jgi:hypothetical protein
MNIFAAGARQGTPAAGAELTRRMRLFDNLTNHETQARERVGRPGWTTGQGS